MFVSEIHIFPVKGLAGSTPPGAAVEPWGLQHDRRWMVVDETGRFLSQRVLPRMALIRAEPAAGGLALSYPGARAIHVPVPGAGAAQCQATVWRSTLPASDAGEAASAWLRAVLGQPCRLVHMHDTGARPINPAFAPAGETVSFADGYPVLLTSLGSLGDLNGRLARPVPISRFRANIVVGGAPAWAEDCWRLIRIGEATFRVVKPCDRCTVTTIDQQTGLRPDRTEPLRTLGRFRHDERGIMFGQNLIPSVTGRIAVGDAVEVLDSGAPNVVPILEG